MTIKEQLIQEIYTFNNTTLLLQIFDFIELLKHNTPQTSQKNNPVVEFAGCLSDEEANFMQDLNQKEFNQTEGEW